MSIVALAGDWHGDTAWAQARVAKVARNGVALILHLGDFGIWPGPGGRRYLEDLEATCAEYGVGIWVTLGNHEDWGRLTELWNDPRRSGQPLQVTAHITLLPRGYRFELEGRSFVSLGGAPSVDRDDRVPGRDWWPEEMIREDEARAVAAGGYADVMLTHDAPLAPFEVPRVAHLRQSNEYGCPRALSRTRRWAQSSFIRRSWAFGHACWRTAASTSRAT